VYRSDDDENFNLVDNIREGSHFLCEANDTFGGGFGFKRLAEAKDLYAGATTFFRGFKHIGESHLTRTMIIVLIHKNTRWPLYSPYISNRFSGEKFLHFPILTIDFTNQSKRYKIHRILCGNLITHKCLRFQLGYRWT
jgi:hypothetical protein